MQFLQNRFLTICAVFTIGLFAMKTVVASEYGQVVRIQCERTGEYLTFDANNDPSGQRRIVVSNQATDNGLWIIKGPLNATVNAGNPYDRWNCTLGTTVPADGYQARLEHLKTGFDAFFGDYYPAVASAGRVYPYTYRLGQERITESSAIHYYNVVLNLFGSKKMLMSNEYLCAYDPTDEAIITQDAVVDTWNIIPVYTITEAQKTLQGQDLLNALAGAAPVVPQNLHSQDPIADQLTQDVQALISFYNNELSYSQVIQNAFSAMVNEPDINQRIAIVENLASNTANYKAQKTVIFGSISHPSLSELITHINSLLVDNRNVTTGLENELEDINQDLAAVGASSVNDLTAKINQLVAALDVLWE